MVGEGRSEREKGAAELEDDCRMEARRNCVVAAATAVETMMSWTKNRLCTVLEIEHLRHRPMRTAFCGAYLRELQASIREVQCDYAKYKI
jgi:hypothetical protein